MITIFFKTLIYFYATVIGTAQILKLKDYRSIVFPLGMFLVAISLFVHPNIVHSQLFNEETRIPNVGTFRVLLPLLLLVIAKLQKAFKQK